MERVKGFTLIELMITLVVAGILLGIAIPSFQNLIVNSRLDSTASELADAVRLARSEAIKRNRPVAVCQVDPAAAGACVTSGRWDGWALHDAQLTNDAKILRLWAVGNHGNTLRVSSNLNSQKATFTGDGLARTGAGGALINSATITVCSTSGTGNKTRNVIFGAAGRVSIESVAGGCP